ncbi:MAG: NAD-dependent protein deacylase [Blautia sp.]|nr:NAD-dependent protein deacylase [Blautia sp.]
MKEYIRDFLSEREKIKYLRSLDEEEKFAACRELLEKAEGAVFLGGAGVSTESGIPDFRSKDGLYRKKDKRFGKYRPEYLLSSECLHKKPEVFFAYFRANLDCRHFQPNEAHKALAELEAKGRLSGIITQNIDGLHQKAGSRNVQEIHGSALRCYCSYCRKEYGPDFIFESQDPVPKCPECGHMVRPDVTLYGEFLPDPAYDNAIQLLRQADLLIIGGTSLAVGSAAQLAHIYHGKHLIIVNKGKTKLEGKADLIFHDSIGKILDLCVH